MTNPDIQPGTIRVVSAVPQPGRRRVAAGPAHQQQPPGLHERAELPAEQEPGRVIPTGTRAESKIRTGPGHGELADQNPWDNVIAHSRRRRGGLSVTDPFSAGTLGGVVLTEGIKFLYQQAGEVLKRWRERRESGGAETERALLRPPKGLLQGTVQAVGPRDDQANALEEELRKMRRLLGDYAEGIEALSPGDQLVAQQTDALRRLLEAAYGQRITFRGEQRPPSGPLVTGEINVKQVAGNAAAIRAKSISSGEARGRAEAERVEQGGKLTGVDIDQIG
jgi:hypothetical protein